MKLSRMLAYGGLVVTALSALSDRDGTVETATEIAMLAKVFGPGREAGRMPERSTAQPVQTRPESTPLDELLR